MFKRATILEHLGRRDEAMAAYQQLINAYPEIPEPYNNLAILTADGGKGDIDHAIELLDRAITANPNFATAHENLGDLYALKALQNYRLGMPANTPANRDARRRVSEKSRCCRSRPGTTGSGSAEAAGRGKDPGASGKARGEGGPG